MKMFHYCDLALTYFILIYLFIKYEVYFMSFYSN